MSNIAGILGLIFGVIGTTLGVLNYLRDRPDVIVELQWDMSVTPGSGYDHTKLWGIIRVANAGRRPIYVSHVALRLPKGFDHTHLVISGGITGVTLKEGDSAAVHLVTQDGLSPYKEHWRSIVAQVNDVSGKTWRSRRIKAAKVPSWAA
jgi:hypothetical protein